MAPQLASRREMDIRMKLRVTASLFAGLAFCAAVPTMANAAKLPAIITSAKNTVPACVTPGRLMVFLRDRNPKLKPRYSEIATEYMRHGEQLGMRWDYAFFQMLVETRNLKYTGDVRSQQNNFAGLGATGGGERGESFKTIGLGARAHMQHTLMYAGRHVEDPVADRTRKVQEWGVLDKWRKKLPKPVTFTHLTRQWSPGDRGYSRDIKATADRFFDRYCDRTDPSPELVALARDETKTAAFDKKKDLTVGEKLAAEALERGRKEGAQKSGLGASSLAEGLSNSVRDQFGTPAPKYKILNKEGGNNSTTAATTTPTIPSADDKVQSAAVAGAAAAQGAASTAAKAKSGECRVWTASYGGSKAVIIKAVSDGLTNFTVLDVNKGREDREAGAYISAYAKGGETIAKYATQTAALDKAFELCPEK